jgi:phage tail tape-measure protein
MEAASKVVATITAAAAAGAAMNAEKIPAPIITAIASVITALGAALIRWIERKILKKERNKLQAENANLRMRISEYQRTQSTHAPLT